MTEHVVENVGLLQIVTLLGRANETSGDETAIGEMFEEHLLRHEPGHGDDLPAGGFHQPFGKLVEVRDAWPRHAQHLQARP